MSANRKTQKDDQKLIDFSKTERYYPYNTFLFLGLVGSFVLFLTICFLYFITLSKGITQTSTPLPRAFSVSTIMMLLSSYALSRTLRAFKNDQVRDLKIALVTTLVFGLLFCVFQFLGWKKLYESGYFLNTNIGVSYLYIISGIHFIHVAGGLIYLTFLTGTVFSQTRDLVKSLLYFSDDFHFAKLQLASVYWHFIDVIWVALFLMFLYTF